MQYKSGTVIATYIHCNTQAIVIKSEAMALWNSALRAAPSNPALLLPSQKHTQNQSITPQYVVVWVS